MAAACPRPAAASPPRKDDSADRQSFEDENQITYLTKGGTL